MTEIRCVKCNRLLFKHEGEGCFRVEVKCPKCGHIHNYTMEEKVKFGKGFKELKVHDDFRVTLI